ncbi:tRNA-dihydrouridine synthase [Candidatus Peregrinibacteria bacterium]|nr:tRNA-dihydrouridine synthase [Candidatus Peregrinibacteria bacterium]
MKRGFWDKLPSPIIGISPMDGVTDAPFRLITAKHGSPHVTITEFTSVEGICHGSVKALIAFKFDNIERPIVAQVYGIDVESFYKSAFVVAELGFDGIDINMGCPATSVSSRGAGAGLIRTPDLAKQIIRTTKQALKDWSEGKKIEDVDLPKEIVAWVKEHQPQNIERHLLPVSVKTRIGYSEITVEEWVKHLLEEEPANICIHGRTLKQMYTGSANWEAIGSAAKIIKQTKTTVMGNGDIHSMPEALEKIKTYGVDGALIGRAAFGNPWLLKNLTPTIEEKFAVAVEHAELYEKILGADYFVPMRKHLAWYIRGFSNASELRQKLMQAKSSQEVKDILSVETLQNVTPVI